jgi:uncharacterized protein (DUF433 family)
MSRPKGRPNIDSFTKHNILQDYRNGVPNSEIVRKYNVERRYARELAKKRGIPSRVRRLQDWERQAIADAYEAGEKTEVIAYEFNVHVSYIRMIAKKFGVPLRPVGKVLRRPSNYGEFDCPY